MNYSECIENARTRIGNYCKACPECNGRACKNQMPGPGAKGVGDTAIRNYDKWKEIRVQMDTIAENKPVDTSLELFGKKFKYPFFAGPVGAVGLHYGDCLDDVAYNDILVSSCAKYGIAAFTGDGVDSNVMVAATKAIKKTDGIGIPTVKPWNLDVIAGKMEMVHESKALAVAMDIDAAGLPFLKNMEPPAGSKTVEELRQIAKMAGTPFIVKGVMTVKGALKAKEAGASAIVVSNHGGRVLDQCPATAEVLEEIARAVGDSMKIFVDGGIRQGTDIFKALAMGADFVMLGRYFARFDESPTQKRTVGGTVVKEYWGEGSNRARNWARYDLGGDKKLQFEEGVDSYVPYAGSLKENVAKTCSKVRATMCNCGALTIAELQKKAKLTLVSATSIVEGGAHDVIRKEKESDNG